MGCTTTWIYLALWDCTLKNDLDGVTWKKMHNLKVENYVLFGRLTKDWSPGDSPSDGSEGPLQRGKGEARIYKNFYKTNPQNRYWNIKRLLLTKKKSRKNKTRHLKLMNLVLFYVWEDARVWAHWSHSFDMLVNYLRPVSCFPPSWDPLSWAAVADSFMATTSFVHWDGSWHSLYTPSW